MIVPEDNNGNLFLTNSIYNSVLMNVPNANFIAMVSDSITFDPQFREFGKMIDAFLHLGIKLLGSGPSKLTKQIINRIFQINAS